MKSTKKPAKKPPAKPFAYGGGAEYEPDPARVAAFCADVARCLTLPDELVECGEISKAERRAAELIMGAMLPSKTPGPRDDRRRDLRRRLLLEAAKPTPPQTAIAQRRIALKQVLPDLRRVLREPSELGWLELRMTLRRINPDLARLTPAQCEKAVARRYPNRICAALTVPVKAFGDRNEQTAFERFRDARECLRKPRTRTTSKTR